MAAPLTAGMTSQGAGNTSGGGQQESDEQKKPAPKANPKAPANSAPKENKSQQPRDKTPPGYVRQSFLCKLTSGDDREFIPDPRSK